MSTKHAQLIRNFVQAVEAALEDAPTVQKAFLKATTPGEIKTLKALNRSDDGTEQSMPKTVFRAVHYAAALQKMQGGAFVLNGALGKAAKTKKGKAFLKEVLSL